MSTLCVIVGLVVILAALWALRRFLYRKMRILSNSEKHPPQGKTGKAPD